MKSLCFAVAAVLVLAGGGLLVCPDGHCRLLPGDAAGLAAFHSWQTPWRDHLFRLLTWGGSFFVLFPLSLLVAWQGYRQAASSWLFAAFVPVALCGATLLVHLAKLVVLRPRPELFPALTAMPADASFPSAHSMQVAAFAAAWLLRPTGHNHGGRVPVLLAPVTLVTLVTLLTLVTLVAVSRIYLQVHFPSDVVIGVLVAVLWVLALRYMPWWRKV